MENKSYRIQTRAALRKQKKEQPIQIKKNEKELQSQYEYEEEEEELDLAIIPQKIINKLKKIPGVEVHQRSPPVLYLPSEKLISLLSDEDPIFMLVYNQLLPIPAQQEIQMTCIAFKNQINAIADFDAVQVESFRGYLDPSWSGIFRRRINIDRLFERLQKSTNLPAVQALAQGTYLGFATVFYGNMSVVFRLYK